MTSRERVRCVLEGGRPDRMPYNFWMDRRRMAEYDAQYGADFRHTHYDADVVEAFVALPWWAGLPMKTRDDGHTVWQLKGLVEQIADASDLPLPDPTDPAVYADLIEKRRRYPDKAIFALLLAPLDIIQPLRLAEGLYTDLLDHSETVHALLRRIHPVLTEAARRASELDIDVLYLAGDVCSRDGSMLSPRALRAFLFEYMRDSVAAAHAAGRKVFYHTDGKVLDILPLFMEYGFDGVNPVEPRYNDAAEFVRRTEGRLMLYGAGDNCAAIPDGTPDEVRAHVRRQFAALGAWGRFIFSTHDIPAHCPRENLDAMVDEIHACRYD